MKYKALIIDGVSYKWAASQDSEHSDYVLVCESGEIWVQIEVGPYDKACNEL